MLPTRALFTRTGLRLFHSAIPRPQQPQSAEPQYGAATPGDQGPMDKYADIVGSTPSTHRDGVTSIEATAPYQIFEAWKTDTFYTPLAFLRSRRIRPNARHKRPPEVGPGAAEAAENDVFHQLDIDPLYESNNDTLLSAFVTTMGRIRPRSYTKLSWRSQRKVTQAIKRSKQKGILPITRRNKLNVPRTYREQN